MNDKNTNIDERRGCTSASNAQADSLCPGRHQAQKGIKPEPPGADADFGKAIHAALAVEVDNAAQQLTGEQRDIFDACRDIEKKLVAEFFPQSTERMRVFREQRYWAKVPSGPRHNDPSKDQPVLYEHSGQPDVVFRQGSKALILEYKTLPGDVPESNRNHQLRDQAVLVRGALLVPEIGVAVAQPLVTMTPTICLYTKEELDQAEKEMFDRVRASNNPDSPRKAGEVQCKYCRAKSTCQVYQSWVGTLLPAPVSLFDVPMASWTGAQCAAFCAGRAAAQKWLDDATQTVKDLLKANPEAVPGWELKAGKTRTKVVDPTGLHGRFLELGGKPEDFLKCIEVVKGRLEEQMRSLTKTKGKELKAQVDKMLEGLTESKQDEPSLARKKD